MDNDRAITLLHAENARLIDLAEQIIHGEYTPGIEDAVLLERLKELDI